MMLFIYAADDAEASGCPSCEDVEMKPRGEISHYFGRLPAFPPPFGNFTFIRAATAPAMYPSTPQALRNAKPVPNTPNLIAQSTMKGPFRSSPSVATTLSERAISADLPRSIGSGDAADPLVIARSIDSANSSSPVAICYRKATKSFCLARFSGSFGLAAFRYSI
jgi:hypothetical protein